MEMARAVVGSVRVGAQISLLLRQLISGGANAPALVQTVLDEINDFNSILSLLQPLLLGLSPLNLSRASMVYVDHLVLTLTGCVFTLSEMEKEVNGLKPIGRMRTWDQLKWSRMEPTISHLFQRLLSHKSSLALILKILTSPSLAEATDCSVTFREHLVEGIPHMPSPTLLGSTLAISGDHTTNTTAGPRSTVGHLSPKISDSGPTVDNPDLVVDRSASIRTVADTRVVNSYRLACESILFTTRPYRGRSNNSVVSLEGSQRPKAHWSLISGRSNRSVLSLPVSDYEFSGLSLAEASDISTLPLPISVDKLRNPKWYASNTTGTVPPRLTLTRNRGEPLRQFASKNRPPILLHRAAELGKLAIVKLFLEQGADIEAKDQVGNTALHVAARNNHVSVVGLLLDRGAAMEALGLGGGTPLHYAAWNGHDSTVGLLLDRGANIEAKFPNRPTSLHDILSNNRDSVVGLLLNPGAGLGAIYQNRETALHIASSNGHGSTVGLLLDRGANVEAKCQNGETPLHYASFNGHDSIVGLLLDRRASIVAQGYIGKSPLHYASSNGHNSTVGLLLDRGADIEARCLNGFTPLHYMSSNGHDSIVGLLLDRGADIEAKYQHRETPLHIALFKGHNSTVGLLLDRGADKHAQTRGKTPLEIARCQGHSVLIQLLQ